MALAALERLDLHPDIVDVLDAATFVPQVGQGALAIECRADDTRTRALLERIEHGPTRRAVDAERAFLAELGGDCTLPAGAHATIVDGGVRIAGVLASTDERTLHRRAVQGTDGEALGRALARALVDALGDQPAVP
jgi:hydroxymethylbilane synthase